MRDSIVAGALYFVCVFAAGFVLGTIRVLFVIPAIGELAAVLMELPLLLVWSWIVCGRLVRGRGIPAGLTSRAAMGATGLALLVIVEGGFSIVVEGRSVAALLAQYRALPALLGLVGQITFALIPLWR